MPTGDHAVVAHLRSYLSEAAAHDRSWAIGLEPLKQRVSVQSDEWRERTALLDLGDEVRRGVEQALDGIAAQQNFVDRSLLTTYALAAADSEAALVRCWFCVMTWGAGPQNRSRLRQWTRALPSPRLIKALARSRAELVGGRPCDAYKTSMGLPGLGEAYLTKWLWVLGLGGVVGPPQPYVLDNYVWQSLNRLGWSAQGRNQAARWVDFCQAVDRWAHQLADQEPHWHIDGDRVEQLLFDRNGRGVHFYKWLDRVATPSS